MDVVLDKTTDLLSLYTEVDTERRVLGPTRSVVLHDAPGELVLLDNLEFLLHISVPLDLHPGRLKNYMVESYARRHFGRCKQVSPEKLSPGAHTLLQLVEQRNTTHYAHYIDGQHTLLRAACLLDADLDLFSGLYAYDDTARLGTRRADDDETDEEEEEVRVDTQISTELVNLYGANEVSVRFPGQKQYRLVFNNHRILHYFLNLFLDRHSEAALLAAQERGDEQLPFLVHVVDLESERHRGKILPLNKKFTKKALCTDYIERQIRVSRPTPLRFASRQLATHGLLHSGLPRENAEGAGRSHRGLAIFNSFDQMQLQKDTTAAAFAYQCLTLDLADATRAVYRVNYGEGKFFLSMPSKRAASVVVSTPSVPFAAHLDYYRDTDDCKPITSPPPKKAAKKTVAAPKNAIARPKLTGPVITTPAPKRKNYILDFWMPIIAQEREDARAASKRPRLSEIQ